MKIKFLVSNKTKRYLSKIIIMKLFKINQLKILNLINIIKIIFTRENNSQLVCAKKRLSRLCNKKGIRYLFIWFKQFLIIEWRYKKTYNWKTQWKMGHIKASPSHQSIIGRMNRIYFLLFFTKIIFINKMILFHPFIICIPFLFIKNCQIYRQWHFYRI